MGYMLRLPETKPSPSKDILKPCRVAAAATAGDALSKSVAGWYAEVTANQTGITTQVDLTGLSVTITTVAGQRIRITAEIYGVGNTVATDATYLWLMEGATQLNGNGKILGSDTPNMTISAVVTPSAGSHTYKLQMSRAGTGTVTMYAAATSPAYILAEAI